MLKLSAEHERKMDEREAEFQAAFHAQSRADAAEHERKLKAALDEATSHLHLREENKNLLAEIKRLEKELEDLTTAAADRDALRRELQAKDAEIERLAKENERLTAELADLRAAEKTAQDALLAEIRKLLEQLASARPAGEHEAGDLHTIADLRAKITRLEAELKAARSDAQTQHETIARLQAHIVAMT
jgi:chromosome segregation ATPase